MVTVKMKSKNTFAWKLLLSLLLGVLFLLVLPVNLTVVSASMPPDTGGWSVLGDYGFSENKAYDPSIVTDSTGIVYVAYVSVRAPFDGESGRFFSFSMAGSFAGNGGMM
jgi:hypothetical protein